MKNELQKIDTKMGIAFFMLLGFTFSAQSSNTPERALHRWSLSG